MKKTPNNKKNFKIIIDDPKRDFTKIPNSLILKLMKYLTGNQLKLLLYFHQVKKNTDLSYQEIKKNLGFSRQTTNKVINELKGLKIITEYKGNFHIYINENEIIKDKKKDISNKRSTVYKLYTVKKDKKDDSTVYKLYTVKKDKKDNSNSHNKNIDLSTVYKLYTVKKHPMSSTTQTGQDLSGNTTSSYNTIYNNINNNTNINKDKDININTKIYNSISLIPNHPIWDLLKNNELVKLLYNQFNDFNLWLDDSNKNHLQFKTEFISEFYNNFTEDELSIIIKSNLNTLNLMYMNKFDNNYSIIRRLIYLIKDHYPKKELTMDEINNM